MNFRYTEKKIKLPESVHAYAEKKVTKLERYFNAETEAVVAFSVEKNMNKVELTLHVASTYFRTSEATSDIFASIDAPVTSIERQSRKYKTRLSRRLRPDAFSVKEEPTSFVEEVEEGFDVIRTKNFAIKPMSVDEAILQMNLLDHSFFAFRNEDNENAFAVVYRRNGGGYGLIEDSENN